MNIKEQCAVGMLSLSVRGGYCADSVKLATDQIRQLPGVLRVRTDAGPGQVEIMFQRPAPGLLRRVHTALKLAGEEVIAGKTW